MLNKSGKILSIFVVLTLVLLVSSTCVGFFLYHKEQQVRQVAEGERDVSRESEAKLQAELKDVKKQLVLVQDKNKEADQKINSLLDEMDLNEGLRNELKKENSSLKEQLEGFNKSKEKMKVDLDDSAQKLKQFQDLLQAEQEKSRGLQSQLEGLEQAHKDMESKMAETQAMPSDGKGKIQLDKIIVNPGQGREGYILSIDREAEFIVFNLGSKNGVAVGNVLSVYRGDEYLGDVKITRVQDAMSAADIILPLSGRKLRKSDVVVLKP